MHPRSSSVSLLQIYYYANSIYSSAGVRPDDIQYVTVGTGAVNVFMTIAAVGYRTSPIRCENRRRRCAERLAVFPPPQVSIVEASGRRVLLLCGFGICCGACVLLTVALSLQVSVSELHFITTMLLCFPLVGPELKMREPEGSSKAGGHPSGTYAVKTAITFLLQRSGVACLKSCC